MGAFYTEEHTLADERLTTLAHDMVLHLYVRHGTGQVLVVATDPIALLCIVRKEWLALLRVVQRERAATLRGDLIREFSIVSQEMRKLVFTAKPPQESPKADVFFLGESGLQPTLPKFQTIYVTCEVSPSSRTLLDELMAISGDAISYHY